MVAGKTNIYHRLVSQRSNYVYIHIYIYVHTCPYIYENKHNELKRSKKLVSTGHKEKPALTNLPHEGIAVGSGIQVPFSSRFYGHMTTHGDT